MYASGEFSRLIRDRIGIELPKQSLESLDVFICSKTKELGYNDLNDYIKRLYDTNVLDPLFQELVDVTTNGKTLFFRHLDQLNDIRDELECCYSDNQRPPRVWSAGCATGEEVYSLAIMADEAGLPIEILGTDVCRSSIEAALRGIYGGWQLENTGRCLPDRYFTRSNGQLTIVDELKQKVRFEQHNLLDSDYPQPLEGDWDIILCRNVFIYFHRDTVFKVLSKILTKLTKNGLLFIGPSESIYGLHDRFRLLKIGQSFGYKLIKSGEMQDKKIFQGENQKPTNITTQTLEIRCHAPVKDTKSLIERAIEAHQRADYNNAMNLLQSHLDDQPKDWVARVALGNLFLIMKEYAKSLEQYTTALDLDPFSAEIHFFLGMLYKKTDQPNQAIEAYKRALFLDGSLWLAAFYLASLYAKSGQKHLAKREYQHTLRISTNSEQGSIILKSKIHELRDIQRYQNDICLVCKKKLEELNNAG